MNSMKIVCALTILFFVGCKKDTVTSVDDNLPLATRSSIIEGTVYYCEGGGTVEMPYPEGFRMKSIQWITQTADSALPVYLSGAVDSSYVNKHVRAFGTVQKKTLYGTPTSYVYSLLEMKTDSLQVVN